MQGLITDSMLSGEEYEDVLDDIKQECERSGPVADIKIPREGELKVNLVKWRACPISIRAAPSLCRLVFQQGACFVRFSDLAGAAKARESLHLRQFDGHTVTAKFISVEQMPA